MNRKIQSLSFVFACMVPLIHLTSFGGADFDVYTASWWFYSVVCHGVAMIAVPFFFFVSGYLLAKHNVGKWLNGDHITEIRKRCKSLLIPMIIWGILWWVIVFRFRCNLLDCVGLCLSIPRYDPLWYLRTLFLFVCLSPLILQLAQRRFVLGCLFAISIVYPLLVPSGSFFTFLRYFVSPLGAFYFALGMGVQRQYYSVCLNKGVGIISMIVGLVILSLKCLQIDCHHFTTVISSIATPLFLYGIWSVVPQFTIPKLLHGTSMLIYLSHEFVIYALFVAMRICGLRNSDFMIYVINAFLVVFLTVSVATIMRSKFPITSKILTGGR